MADGYAQATRRPALVNLHTAAGTGNAIVPFYGQAAGTALTDLLKQHILIAVDLLVAAKAGDDARFQQEDQKWSRNAEEVAALLSSANS